MPVKQVYPETGGSEAQETTVQAVADATRIFLSVPPVIKRSASGSQAVLMRGLLLDGQGNMEDPDANEMVVRIVKGDGTFITDRFFSNSGLSSALASATDQTAFPTASGWRAMSRDDVGFFKLFYKNDNAHAEEKLLVEVAVEEAGVKLFNSFAMEVVDAADIDDISTKVTTLHDTRATEARLSELDPGTPGKMAAEVDILKEADVIRRATAQAGAASSITLDASASATNDLYKLSEVIIVSGTGIGQRRLITAYNGTTKVATIAPAWAVNPDATSVFLIKPAGDSLARAVPGSPVAGSFEERLATLPATGTVATSADLAPIKETGDGGFDRETDSLEALRDRLDAINNGLWKREGSPGYSNAALGAAVETTIFDKGADAGADGYRVESCLAHVVALGTGTTTVRFRAKAEIGGTLQTLATIDRTATGIFDVFEALRAATPAFLRWAARHVVLTVERVEGSGTGGSVRVTSEISKAT